MKTVTFVYLMRLWLVCISVIWICECVAEGSSRTNGGQGTGALRYNREFLLSFQTPIHSDFSFCDFPDEMKSDNVESNENADRQYKRKRGRRGGVRRRLRRNKTRPPLPSMILANVRSINPKSKNMNFDGLQADCRFNSDFKDACVMCFSETWLNDNMSDSTMYIDGFGKPFRMDRDSKITRKQLGGGVCLYVNERWCDRQNVIVKKKLSTPELELLSVSIRPRYLPREFGRIFLTVVYAPVYQPAAAARAATTIADTVRELQLLSPDAPCFVVGDFNHCDLRKALPTFKQYVTCKTRLNNTIDLCYGNIPNAYKSIALPSVGMSDHDVVHLLPAYRPRIKTEPIVQKKVKLWSTDSIEKLQGCFECTNWDIFFNSCDNVNDATEVISSYITFCEDMLIPTKTIKIFPNNKPWITKSLKATLNEKKIAFQSGDRKERKLVQIKLRSEIREAKRQYKEQVERQFEYGNMKNAWKGLKLLSGQAKCTSRASHLSSEEQQKFANKLNDFYCRFERTDFEEELNKVKTDIHSTIVEGTEDFEISENSVKSLFVKLKTKKAVGPDHISGTLLKACASQLSTVFSKLFIWSFKDCCVPNMWKKSIICPVPKKNNPISLNDYRPVALTPVVMKCFERLILCHLLKQTHTHLDQYQFAYKQKRSVDDAILTLLHNAFTHLNKSGSFVRILFVDFSSAFNTIQPHLIARKLLNLDISPRLILWIVNFLTNRSQSVRFQNSLSSQRHTFVGSPQGTVLSPILFTLYTNDCKGTITTPIIKYSDDTAIQDLSNSDATYFKEIDKFGSWCKSNFLDLNILKTKEMLIDFRKNPLPVPDLVIEGVKVERVKEYKYLGAVIDDKLDFNAHINYIHKKCQSRIYCLQKLRNLSINVDILQMFYRNFIESVLTFAFMCWFGSLGVKSKNVLNRVVNVCSKVVGKRQANLIEVYECRVVQKARAIVEDESHVLFKCYELLPSGRRYRTLKCKRRTQNSFVPRSIHLLNR